jgi:uncharacterized membrane protein
VAESRVGIGRKLIAITPLLLVCGIVAQLLLLVAAIVLYVPCLVWPEILDGPYRMITRGMVRVFAKGIIGSSKRTKTGVVTSSELSFRYLDTPGEVPPVGRVLCYDKS